MMFATADDRRIMSGIAIVKVTGFQIQESEEERHEHAALIVLTR